MVENGKNIPKSNIKLSIGKLNLTEDDILQHIMQPVKLEVLREYLKK